MKRFEDIIGIIGLTLATAIIIYLAWYVFRAILEMGGLFEVLIYILTIEVY